MDNKTEDKLTQKIAEKIYDDTASPALQEVGGFFAAITGFFNHVVAAPLHRLNAKFKIKTEAYIRNLYEEYQKIPENHRQEPPINIIGPTLEALKYELDEEALSEMFTNLLLSSMDDRIESKCHPAYVKIISQMNAKDAIVLKGIFQRRNAPFAMVKPKCAIDLNYQGKKLSGYHIHADKFPELYIGDIENLTPFEISKSLYNLNRLGIIEINKTFALRNDFFDIYKQLIESDTIKNIYSQLDTTSIPGCSLDFDKGSINFTEFGKDFAESVIKE